MSEIEEQEKSEVVDREDPEQVALSEKIRTKVLDVDSVGAIGSENEVTLESDSQAGSGNQTSRMATNLSKRRYLDRHDGARMIRAAIGAAQNDRYEIKEVVARGAEAVLYRSVCGAFTFCSKSIRNGWNKWIGSTVCKGVGEKLDNVAYRTKVRHIQNEFNIARKLHEESAMPVVRIYALRPVKRFGIELGYDLLMEFLSGHDLGDKILSKVLPLEDKIRVLYQSVQALSYVHKKKIVHLDIKPSNFMLVNGKVKLIDFGVSVVSGYHTQAVTGTVGYLSPEQICRDVVDERADLFALGVAFGVFFGGKILPQNQEDLLSKKMRDEAKYHMEHTDTPSIVDIPGLMEMPLVADVLRQCTVMRRDKRIQSCASMLAQLREAAERYGIVLTADTQR